MNFQQAVRSGFSNYVNFSGRAVRSEYWYWALFVFIVDIPALLIDLVIVNHRHGPLEIVWHLATFLPSLALAVRRLHDTDRTGWWLPALFVVALLLALIFAFTDILPMAVIVVLIGMLVLVYWFCQPGTPGPNRFGPDPFDAGGHISQPPTA